MSAIPVKQYREMVNAKPHRPKKKAVSKAVSQMAVILAVRFPELKVEQEFKFHPTRKWRFDFAIPDKMIAIEYEGVYGGGKSRHTTVGGYTADAEKYNEAAKLGWKVLRYTAKSYTKLIDDLKQML